MAEPDPLNDGSWLAALHDAVAADRDSEFELPHADTVPLRQFEAIRNCLRRLEGARRAGMSLAAETTATASHPEQDAPKHVGRFEIIRELGRGGCGVVFLAFDPAINRHVALKVPRPEILISAATRRRFLREARAAGALAHPNLVPVYEVGEIGPLCYIASTYCDGPNLEQWLAAHRGQVAVHPAVELMATLARGIAHSHARGVLHRDIKPANVLLAPADDQASARDLSQLIPRLTDFGLAKVLEGAEEDTRTGSLLGTPAYMAPEQAEARFDDVGPATDVYALGMVLYELLTGHQPFRGFSHVQTLQRVAHGEIPRPAHFRPELSRDLEAIVLKCLERETRLRYNTAQELADDLNRYLQGVPPLARPAGPLRRTVKWVRRRPRVAALSAIVCFAVLSLIGGGWWYSARLGQALADGQRYSSQVRQQGLEKRQFQYVTNVSLAARALNDNQLEQARALLDRDVPAPNEADLRGFAWRHLRQQLHDEELTLTGHTGEVYHVAYSPLGTTLATASQDHTVRLWNCADGSCQHVLSGHDGEVNCVAFSRDGVWLASASDDGTVRIWDPAKGTLVHTIAAHAGGAYCVAFSPNRAALASGGRDHVVRLWGTADWQQLTSYEGHSNDVSCLSFGRNGTLLATGGDDHRVCLWDLNTNEQVGSYEGHASGGISSVAFSMDDAKILSCGRSERVAHLWDTLSGKQIKSFGPYYAWLRSATFLEQDRHLILSTKDGQVETVDIESADVIRQFNGHVRCVWSLAASPDGRHLATASTDRTVRIWNLRRGCDQESLADSPTSVRAFALSHDGQTAVIGGVGGVIAAWDVPSRQLLWRDRIMLEQPVDQDAAALQSGAQPTDLTAEHLACHPGHPMFAINCSGDKRISFYEARNGRRLSELSTSSDSIDSLAFSPDGRVLAAGDREGFVTLVDVESRAEFRRQSLHESGPSRLAYSPNGRWLAVAGGEAATITVLDALTLAAIRVLQVAIPEDWSALEFSRDGQYLAAGGTNRLVHVWRIPTGEKVAALAGHEKGISSVSFSPDGRTLVSTDSAGKVKLSDTTTWQDLYMLHSTFSGPCFAAFDNRGHELVAAGPTKHCDKLRCWSSQPPLQLDSGVPARGGATIRVGEVDSGYQRDYMWASDSLAADKDGNVVVTWYSQRQRESVRARVFDVTGTPLSPELEIDSRASTLVPAVAVNDQKQFLIVWPARDEGSSEHQIFARRYDFKGQPLGLVTQVSQRSLGVCSINYPGGFPSAILDDQGNFSVLWRGADGAQACFYLRRFDASGQPLGDETKINTVNDVHLWARLAKLPEGAAVAAWSAKAPTKGRQMVCARRIDSQGRFLDDREWRVDPHDLPGSRQYVDVATSPDGQIVVTWTDFRLAGSKWNDIYFRRFDSNGRPLSAAMKASEWEGVSSSSVSVAANGQITVGWESLHPWTRAFAVAARNFDADGAPLGPSFLLAPQSVGPHSGSCVGHGPGNELFVTWVVNYLSPRGVFLQRFNLTPDALR